MNVNPPTPDDVKILLGKLNISTIKYLCSWWYQQRSETSTEPFSYPSVTSHP